MMTTIGICMFILQGFMTLLSVMAGLMIPVIAVNALLLATIFLMVIYIEFIPKEDDKDRSYLFLFWMELLIILCSSISMFWHPDELLEITLSVFLFAVPTMLFLIMQKGSFRNNLFLKLSCAWMLIYYAEKVSIGSSEFYVRYSTIYAPLGNHYENSEPLIALRDESFQFPINCKHPNIAFHPSLPNGLYFNGTIIAGTLVDPEPQEIDVQMFCNQLVQAARSTLRIVPCDPKSCLKDQTNGVPFREASGLYNRYFWLFQSFLCFFMLYEGRYTDGAIGILIHNPRSFR